MIFVTRFRSLFGSIIWEPQCMVSLEDRALSVICSIFINLEKNFIRHFICLLTFEFFSNFYLSFLWNPCAPIICFIWLLISLKIQVRKRNKEAKDNEYYWFVELERLQYAHCTLATFWTHMWTTHFADTLENVRVFTLENLINRCALPIGILTCVWSLSWCSYPNQFSRIREVANRISSS